MATLFTEDFENVVNNGNTLTESNTSFDNVLGGGTMTGTTAVVLAGARSAAITAQATQTYGQFVLTGGRAITSIRGSFRLPSAPAANAYHVSISSTGVAAQLGFTPGLTIRMRNNSSVEGTPIAISLNTKYYYQWTVNNTAGTMSCTLYNSSGTSLGTMSGTYDQGTMDNVLVGSPVAVSGGWSIYFDELEGNNTSTPPSLPTVAKSGGGDTGTATETYSISSTLATSDTGAGADASSVSSVNPSSFDTASGSESQSVVARVTGTDSSAGVDAGSVSVNTTLVADTDTFGVEETASVSVRDTPNTFLTLLTGPPRPFIRHSTPQ